MKKTQGEEMWKNIKVNKQENRKLFKTKKCAYDFYVEFCVVLALEIYDKIIRVNMSRDDINYKFILQQYFNFTSSPSSSAAVTRITNQSN